MRKYTVFSTYTRWEMTNQYFQRNCSDALSRRVRKILLLRFTGVPGLLGPEQHQDFSAKTQQHVCRKPKGGRLRVDEVLLNNEKWDTSLRIVTLLWRLMQNGRQFTLLVI